MKKNLIFLTLLISVLMISVVSAGITGYVLSRGQLVPGTSAQIESVDAGTSSIVVDGEKVEAGETFTRGNRAYEVVAVEEPTWFLGKPKVAIKEIPQEEFMSAMWECYDGTSSTQGDETSCKSSETWQSYAEEFCKEKCNEDKSKCGVNSFSVGKSCVVEEGCKDYTLSEEGTNTFTINGQPIGIGFNENGFFFSANQGPESDLFSYSFQVGGSINFLEQIITILDIDKQGKAVSIKVCPGEKPEEPETCTSSCKYIQAEDVLPKGTSASISAIDVCSKFANSYSPAGLVEGRTNSLYSDGACSPSYLIFRSSSDIWFSLESAYSKALLTRTITPGTCSNLDMSKKFSIQQDTQTYKGVLCCSQVCGS